MGLQDFGTPPSGALENSCGKPRKALLANRPLPGLVGNKRTTHAIILASTSPYRTALLRRLGLPFSVAAPDIDESPLTDETPTAMAKRLAEAKARVIAIESRDSLIIGADQVAYIADRVLGKPGSRDKAFAQLRAASGKAVTFHTGVCLLNTETGRTQTECELFKVHFRALSDAQIARYLNAEQPFNCAGSFKAEGLGISLFSRLEGDDPSALIGLPLIRLVDMFHQEGVAIP